MKKFLINLITFFSLYKIFLSNICKENQFYNQTTHSCQNCDDNSKYLISCMCKNNKTIFEFNNDTKTYNCTKTLNKGEFATDDHLSYVKYEYHSDDSLMEYDSSTDEVKCNPKDSVTYEPSANDVFGNKFDRIMCIPNTISDSTKLIRRLDEEDCIKNTSNTNTNRRLDGESSSDETNNNISYWQNIANLCTLNFFEDCDSIKAALENENTKSSVPNLFPSIETSKNAEEYIKDESVLNYEVSYKPEHSNIYINHLEFYVAVFYSNGIFKEMAKLEDKFIFCSNSYNAASNFSMFGNDVQIDCNINLNELYKKEELLYYEIFLKNALRDEKNFQLISIPVLVDNIKFENENQNETDMKNWVLGNRMFLIKQSGNKYIYAQRIKLVVELKNERKNHKIYRPYFEIYYSNSTELTSPVYVSFISEYKVDIKNFMKACLAFLIVCIIIVLIIVVFRMIVWVQLNPRELTPESFSKTFILTLLMKICKWWGLFSFWYCFICCAYWYFFFKLANRIYLLMPPQEQYKKYYRKFDIMFGIGFGTYMIFMILRIYFQVSFDIFFIDWEHEKELFKNNSGDEATTSKYRKYRGAWRLIHVANQFNALQKQRLTSLFFAFCWHIILYYKAHWDNRELQTPGTGLVYYGRMNYILRLFISTCIIFSALIIQYVVVRLLQNWIPLKKQEFIDLCFVSNISVFILDEKLHGFYIHGHNPSNKADVNLNELLNYLNNAENIINPELDNNDNDIKSYVMYISYPMRTIYDGLFYIQNEALLAQNQGIDIQKFIKERKLGAIFKYLPEIEEKNFNMLSSYMNNQLRNKMDNVFKNKNVYIREKTFLQNILELPANNTQINITNAEEIILYKDEGLKFDDVFFSGMEWEWMMMDMFIYQFWTRILHNCEIGILLTYVCDYFLYYIRAYLGEKNVSKKSVIDERFFS